jgi:hypothetical protein
MTYDMQAVDWMNVDLAVEHFAARADVWMYDVQSYLRDKGTSQTRAFLTVCDSLRKRGITLNFSE